MPLSHLGPASHVQLAIACLATAAVIGDEGFVRGCDVYEDATLSPAGLMKKNGYPTEVYKVTTEDGYILEVDRMPQGRLFQNTFVGNTRPVVLMLHGLFTSAADFVLNSPGQSAGFLLADSGFDVWLLNTRGTPYSNYHVSLRTNDPRFWKWSFEEIGLYDVSATVDFILNLTGRPSLSIVGWSQGFTETLALLSLRPEYNGKVNVVAGYGPVANITHIQTPLTILAPLAEQLLGIVDQVTHGALLTSSELSQTLIAIVCNGPLREACFLPDQIAIGASVEQLNRTRIPVYVAHQPAGTSTQNVLHYAQIYRAKNFNRYDYGPSENLRRYNQTTAPPFPTENVSIPIGLFRGPADRQADPRDIDDVVEKLGDWIVLNYYIPERTFQHLDFSVGSYATDILHKPMIQFLRSYASA